MILARHRASRLNDQAGEACRRGDRDEAIALYKKAIDLAPDWEAPWFNLGLVYKGHRDWERVLSHNQEAAKRLEHTRGEPALWNLGIAATALGRWRLARSAWAAYGL